jgi:cytochrome c biogenesis protein CcmG/thiol:disulfide interchange protein DsbE
MSKSSDNPPTNKTTQRPNTQSRLALLAILLGLLVGVAFVYVYVSSDNGGETTAIASRSEDSASGQGNNTDAIAVLLSDDGFPVASARDVDNMGNQPTVGHPAPNFAIQLDDGSTATLHDIAGRPIVINFWATWCPPCRREMPDLVEAYETHKGEGLIVIEVNSAETAAQVADFVEQFNVTAPVVLDARNEVMAIYRTNSLPASFFIDRDGVIQAHWPGFMDKDTLDELLGKIL